MNGNPQAMATLQALFGGTQGPGSGQQAMASRGAQGARYQSKDLPYFNLGGDLRDNYLSMDKEGQRKFLQGRGLWNNDVWWDGRMWVNGRRRENPNEGDGEDGKGEKKWETAVDRVKEEGARGMSDAMRWNLNLNKPLLGYGSGRPETSGMAKYMDGGTTPVNYKKDPYQHPGRPDERNMRLDRTDTTKPVHGGMVAALQKLIGG